jgi:hypothetical protein
MQKKSVIFFIKFRSMFFNIPLASKVLKLKCTELSSILAGGWLSMAEYKNQQYPGTEIE